MFGMISNDDKERSARQDPMAAQMNAQVSQEPQRFKIKQLVEDKIFGSTKGYVNNIRNQNDDDDDQY